MDKKPRVVKPVELESRIEKLIEKVRFNTPWERLSDVIIVGLDRKTGEVYISIQCSDFKTETMLKFALEQQLVDRWHDGQ